MDTKVNILNHQHRGNKLLEVANSSAPSPLEDDLEIDDALVRDFDWKPVFEELVALKDIIDGKEKEPTILEQLKRNTIAESLYID